MPASCDAASDDHGRRDCAWTRTTRHARGPLWEPLCYAQIGGLTIATFVTLLLVPVMYSIFVLDLKLIKWETPAAAEPTPAVEPTDPSSSLLSLAMNKEY